MEAEPWEPYVPPFLEGSKALTGTLTPLADPTCYPYWCRDRYGWLVNSYPCIMVPFPDITIVSHTSYTYIKMIDAGNNLGLL